MVRDKQRGGTYNYFQDCVFINRDIVVSYDLESLRWIIFHEFAHALTARIFAKQSFFPGVIVIEPLIEDLVKNVVNTMWRGLSDYLVNELVFVKASLKKIDHLLEQTGGVKTISNLEASGMCFHLFDYWKHGRNEKVKEEAIQKIPPEVLRVLDQSLPQIELENPKDTLLYTLKTVAYKALRINVRSLIVTREFIEKNASASLPAFWRQNQTKIEILQATLR